MSSNNNQESSGLAIGADLWISLKLSITVDYTANEELQARECKEPRRTTRRSMRNPTIPAAMVVPTSRTYHSKAPPPPFLFFAYGSDQQRLTIHHHGSIFFRFFFFQLLLTTLAR